METKQEIKSEQNLNPVCQMEISPTAILPPISSASYKKYPSDEAKSIGSNLSIEDCIELEKKSLAILTSYLCKRLSAKVSPYKLHKKARVHEYGAVTIEMPEGPTVKVNEILIKHAIVLDASALETSLPAKFKVVLLKEFQKLTAILKDYFKNPTFIFFNGADRNINMKTLVNDKVIANIWISQNDIKELEEERIDLELNAMNTALMQVKDERGHIITMNRILMQVKDEQGNLKAMNEALMKKQEHREEEVKCIQVRINSILDSLLKKQRK